MLCMSASYIQSTHVLCPRVSSTLPFWFLVFISASDRLKKNRKKKSNEWTLNGNFVISYERFWVEIDAKPPSGREKERKRWLQWNIIPRNSHRYFIIGARIAFRNALPAAAATAAAVKRPSTMRHEPQRAAATAEDYISDIDLIPMVLTVNLYVPIFFFRFCMRQTAHGAFRTRVFVCERVCVKDLERIQFFIPFSLHFQLQHWANAHVSFILHLQILRGSDKKIVLAQSSLKC